MILLPFKDSWRSNFWNFIPPIFRKMNFREGQMNKELKRLRNALPFRELYKHLCRILKGYYNYFGFAGNFATLRKFEYAIRRLWFKWLNRRSQRKSFKWKEFEALLTRYPLPEPRIRKGYRWIYSATLWICLKSPVRENCMLGSVRGGGSNP